MDKDAAKSLRHALDLLKSGDVKSARAILVDFLKTNPENEQAWYMLSFAVSDPQKQIYSLNQVLEINPTHEKARNRLSAITGESFNGSVAKQYPREKAEVYQTRESEPQVDLLSQRLFGESEIPEQKQKDSAEVVPKPGKTEPLPSGAVKEPDTQPLNIRDEIKSKPIGIPVINKLLAKIPRRILFLFTLCVVAGGVVVILFWGNKGLSNILPSQQLPGRSSEASTTTPTSQPTPTEIGGALPPTWTPVSPEDETKPYFGSDSIFTITSLTTPSPEILGEMTKIQNEMLSSRFDRLVGVDSFIVSKRDFEQLLTDFLSIPEYNENLEKRELVYQALGLINPWDDLINLFPNIWADSNGSVFLPDEGAILLASDKFTIVEKYLYAREYAQALIDDQMSLQELGIYPICFHRLQQCEVLNALIKGDATRDAGNWLTTFGASDQLWMVDNLEVDYFNLPIQSPPIFIEMELDFPYTAGFTFVNSLWDQGGEDFINAVYENLPSTTEQILHPEKYMDGEQEILIDDIPLDSILNDDWQGIFNESIGEWLTYQFLVAGVNENARISTEESELAAAGWGGDRTQIYYNDTTGQFVISAYWSWDSLADANEFHSALSENMKQRYVDAEQIEKSGADCWQTDSEINCIVMEASDVIWLSAPDMTTMDSLLGLYTSGS